eukprot:m.191285 g.191285  ORF g.191285 m.191285 type:complete len:72 (-) comp18246_c2_seq1:652-867(-)
MQKHSVNKAEAQPSELALRTPVQGNDLEVAQALLQDTHGTGCLCCQWVCSELCRGREQCQGGWAGCGGNRR